MNLHRVKAVLIAMQALAPAAHGFVNRFVQPMIPSSGVATAATSEEQEVASRAKFDDVVMKTYGRYPITMVKGDGCTLTDSTGKTYLDFVAGIATCCLGHNHPKLTKAVTDQMSTLHHVSNLYYIPAQERLASWLVDNSPMDRVFFCNSGAEANEAAIKLARKHAHTKLGLGKPVIITALSSFHGRTLAAISATGQAKYQKGFDYGGEVVQGFEYVPYNDVQALKAMVERVNLEGAEESEMSGSESQRGVCAIMLEALQGEGGIQPGTDEFFDAARQLCDETGALLICDEVQVGMGRTGKMWGFQNFKNGLLEPDVLTTAKALGGGVPIGAMLCKEACADVFGPGDHASTYGGNPLACAAGVAVGRAIEDEQLLANASLRGEQLRQGLEALLEALAATHPGLLVEVRGWGLINGLEIDASFRGSRGSGLTAGQLVGACMDEGLLLVPAGTHVVRFVPPLVVTAKDVDLALSRFTSALGKCLAKM